ncbi:MAG: hypothetical protein LBF82_02355 [Lactobacillales bacterium]|jgi:hypothetical protein|nr:hypothetical protein [Lactobacillales bacterium]
MKDKINYYTKSKLEPKELVKEVLADATAFFAAYQKVQANKKEVQRQININLKPSFRKLKKALYNYKFEIKPRIIKVKESKQNIQISLKR